MKVEKICDRPKTPQEQESLKLAIRETCCPEHPVFVMDMSKYYPMEYELEGRGFWFVPGVNRAYGNREDGMFLNSGLCKADVHPKDRR